MAEERELTEEERKEKRKLLEGKYGKVWDVTEFKETFQFTGYAYKWIFVYDKKTMENKVLCKKYGFFWEAPEDDTVGKDED